MSDQERNKIILTFRIETMKKECLFAIYSTKIANSLIMNVVINKI